MKRILTITLLSFLISFSAYAADYSSIIEDLPLMQNMQELTDDSVSFDKPAGRIVQLTTITSASIPEISKFYKQSLPPLGWEQKSKNTFARENEVMKIEIKNSGSKNYVTFTIQPK